MKREQQKIKDLVAQVDPNKLSEQVLIKRLRGLEDSSRFWSVNMVLDHLQIVNTQVAELLLDLADGKPREGQASTAAVKPDPSVDNEIMEAFDKSCETLLENAASIHQLQTESRYAHPWFGPLNAYEWFFMATFHMGLHYKQIVKIARAS